MKPAPASRRLTPKTMIDYIACPFKVTLIWYDGEKLFRRQFAKYREAEAWAKENLSVEQIYVKIKGELTRDFNG